MNEMNAATALRQLVDECFVARTDRPFSDLINALLAQGQLDLAIQVLLTRQVDIVARTLTEITIRLEKSE
jgi:hypothetical protein